MISDKKLIYRGSVKDIYQYNEHLLFDFSDRYSIFDWGEMPDLIDGKGAALKSMGECFFYYLESEKSWKKLENFTELIEFLKNNPEAKPLYSSLRERGLKTHWVGDSKLFKDHSSSLEVKKVNVLSPKRNDSGYDYSEYKNDQLVDCLVPLEVLFRFGVPKGSSFLRRAKDLEYCHELGLSGQKIEEGTRFQSPIIEFSTKLEPLDRVLQYEEAKDISGLNDSEFAELCTLTKLIAFNLKHLFSKMEIELWDGKFEFSFIKKADGTRGFQLVDSIGPDELRLMFQNIPLSKEVLRQAYKKSNWYSCFNEQKEKLASKNIKDWQKEFHNLGLEGPHKLDSEFIKLISEMYQYLSQGIQGIVFDNLTEHQDIALVAKTIEKNLRDFDE
ncbi:MAG: phosphoribosylaminoimidazolesuccinocarboxamide synthase [Bacteriovoracaceae bacterium]